MRNYYEAIVAMVDELRLYIGQPKARLYAFENTVRFRMWGCLIYL